MFRNRGSGRAGDTRPTPNRHSYFGFLENLVGTYLTLAPQLAAELFDFEQFDFKDQGFVGANGALGTALAVGQRW